MSMGAWRSMPVRYQNRVNNTVRARISGMAASKRQ